MKIAIHQPNYLPALSYFYKMALSDIFLFLDDVQIVLNCKEAITNKTKIRTPQGSLKLTVPIKRNRNKLIHQVEIANDQNWQTKHLKSIKQNYSKARYFSLIYPFLENLFELPQIEIGNLVLVPESVEEEKIPKITEEMKFICISPLVLIIPNFHDNQGKKFIPPEVDDFSDLLCLKINGNGIKIQP